MMLSIRARGGGLHDDANPPYIELDGRVAGVPWKPWPAGGETAFRLSRFNFDSEMIITATVRRNHLNGWEWALHKGSLLIRSGEHHRPGRSFDDAGYYWFMACIADEVFIRSLEPSLSVSSYGATGSASMLSD